MYTWSFTLTWPQFLLPFPCLCLHALGRPFVCFLHSLLLLHAYESLHFLLSFVSHRKSCLLVTCDLVAYLSVCVMYWYLQLSCSPARHLPRRERGREITAPLLLSLALTNIVYLTRSVLSGCSSWSERWPTCRPARTSSTKSSQETNLIHLR